LVDDVNEPATTVAAAITLGEEAGGGSGGLDEHSRQRESSGKCDETSV
jgi:hypothetical protein